MDKAKMKNSLTKRLDQYAGTKAPGLQYLVIDSEGTLFEYAGGWADIKNQIPMTLDHTMMAYSMTKTFTAVAVLQLVELGKLGLDDEIDNYLPDIPYIGQDITVRQLVDHTSGIPNPIPLRWAHLEGEDAIFDEEAALSRVLQENPKLAFEQGEKFAYSNIGYWLLGIIIAHVSGQPYTDFVKSNILLPLGISSQEMDFKIPDFDRHAKGYLAKYSMMNLVKRFFMDSKFWNGYEGNWLLIKNLNLNGPSFGGLVGTTRSFAQFLQDQLQAESIILRPESKRLLETQQSDNHGKPIPMTLGWHIGGTNGLTYFFKEGGGGGYHSEMRLYPQKDMASVMMVNRTNFNSNDFLNRVDGVLLDS